MSIILFLILVLGLSYLIVKRINKDREKPMGYLFIGYISLIVFIVSMFAVLLTSLLISSTMEKIEVIGNGEKCVASIVSYTSYESEDDEGRTTTMYTPIYKLTTADGVEHEVKAEYSSGGSAPVVGSRTEVLFDKVSGSVISSTATTIIMLCGMFALWIVLFSAFAGIFFYAFGSSMSLYFRVLRFGGMVFFLPFIMIGFDALLIYALLHGNVEIMWVKVLLIFFILILSLAIVGYVKKMIKDGLPKWKETGAGSWTADWEDSDKPQYTSVAEIKAKKIMNRQLRKQGIQSQSEALSVSERRNYEGGYKKDY